MSRKVLQQSLFRKVMNSFKCLQNLKGYKISQTDFFKIFIKYLKHNHSGGTNEGKVRSVDKKMMFT